MSTTTKFGGALTAIALLTLTANAWAAPDLKANETHSGKVVTAMNSTLAMTDLQGKNPQSFSVPQDAKITLNGMPVRLSKLTHGDLVTVTLATKNGQQVVATIDAKSGMDKVAGNSWHPKSGCVPISRALPY